jgi:hypothetical protein
MRFWMKKMEQLMLGYGKLMDWINSILLLLPYWFQSLKIFWVILSEFDLCLSLSINVFERFSEFILLIKIFSYLWNYTIQELIFRKELKHLIISDWKSRAILSCSSLVIVFSIGFLSNWSWSHLRHSLIVVLG